MEDFIQVPIEIEAKALARRAGLDPGRVKRVFFRLLDVGWLAPSFPWRTALDEALYFVTAAEAALETFEQADLPALARRVSLVEYLSDDLTPFYTLSELADLARRFILHLEENRSSLLETGYPRTSFSPSPFFDWHLTRLCLTKLPLTVQEGRPLHFQAFAEMSGAATRDQLGNVLYSYTWAKEAAEHLFGDPVDRAGEHLLLSLPGFAWGAEGALSRSTGEPVHECSYELAALAPGLQPSDATRLESMRGQLLDLRLAILRELAAAAEGGRAESLEEDCFALMAQAFTHEDAAFLLRMDAFYEELHASNRIMWTPLRSEAFHSSGLSDLFAAVAHFIKEIRIGTMHETRQGLQRALGDGLASYYQVIGHPGQAAVDAALDSFTTLEEKENPFLAQYQERVSRALETQFSEEVALRIRVRRDRADSFRSMVTSFAEFLKVHVEATGQFPALALTSPTPVPPELEPIELARGGSRLTLDRGPTEPSHENPPYLFRREGDVWRIRFRGNPSTVKHRMGLSYIAELLRHRGDGFPALALYYAVNGTRTGVSSLFAPLEPQTQDASSPGRYDSRESLTPAHARAAAIHEELKDVQKAQDEEREEELLLELEAIQDRLAQQERGDSRVEPDPALERARLSVRQNISRAFVALAAQDQALASFLRQAIRTGHSCSYQPTDPVPWEF